MSAKKDSKSTTAARKSAKPKSAKKAAPKKAAPKKAAPEKAAPRKTAPKKNAARKTVSKKSPAKKKVAAKTDAKKKTPAKPKKSATPAGKKKSVSSGKKAPRKSGASPGKPVEARAKGKGGVASEEVTRRVTEALRKRVPRSEEDELRKGQPVVFSMKDLRDFLKNRKTESEEKSKPETPKKGKDAEAAKPAGPVRSEAPEVAGKTEPSRPKQSFKAASVADLLGFDPTASGSTVSPTSKLTEEGIPRKFLPNYRALVRLHEEVLEGLNRHSEETLRRSNKEDSGDLSSYGQHMADAGTDSFDRDFALSMVSSEQEALYEIDEAIRRLREGRYGICEITGKPISRERLRAVPFTRYSVEGQTEVEKGRVRVVQKAGIQNFDGDDGPVLSDDDADE